MPDTLSVREKTLVGRVAELVTFRQALAGGPAAPVMLYVHGPAGIGKTALLRRFAEEARADGRPVVEVDGHGISARPAAFEAEAEAALDQDRVLLLVDGFEGCQGLETWLRTRFLPRLPERALIVIAGRRPLDPQWRSDPGWFFPLLRTMALGELPFPDADALLDARGVPGEVRPTVFAAAGGHPLALTFASELAVRDRDWRPTGDIAGDLVETLTGEVPAPAYRLALSMFRRVRTVTRGLVRAALPDDDADAVYEWLRGLPFVRSNRRGLYPHEAVREALDAGQTGSAENRDMHRRILRYLVAEVRGGADPFAVGDALEYICSMDNGQRRYLTFRSDGWLYEDTYRPEDRAALVSMAHEAEGKETARLVEFWLGHQPQNIRVYRRADTGQPRAFMALLEFETVRPAECAADPMLAAAWAHCQQNGGLAEGEYLSLMRFRIDPAAPRRPSPAMDMILENLLADLVRARGLKLSYTVWPDPEFWQPLISYVDFRPVPGQEHTPDGHRHVLYVHDWRSVPLPDWVDQLSKE
ncbi:ATP-binding protein [Amycolatopsis sp. GM8]|uniref:ATP-binding protein n=1 Tax=Amycolatopsis sp. GM8 TaxID=2896530 RepID=UPI001F3CD701|nr:ATP-binding protein [Amycolatopsis sp. GM8]